MNDTKKIQPYLKEIPRNEQVNFMKTMKHKLS